MKIKTSMFAVIGLTTLLAGQSNSALQKDSATFDADGTAYVTRIVPMPTTISAEAQQWLASLTKSEIGRGVTGGSAGAHRRVAQVWLSGSAQVLACECRGKQLRVCARI